MAESVSLPDSNHDRAVEVTELFRSHNRTLVRFLQAKLQDPQEAREIAQEAYVRLLELERTGAVGGADVSLWFQQRRRCSRLPRDEDDAIQMCGIGGRGIGRLDTSGIAEPQGFAECSGLGRRKLTRQSAGLHSAIR